jgi:CheY-like chemotaxis protein
MSGKLILLIDHEVSVREVLQVCLSHIGDWDVLSVSSLQEGLEILLTNKPDAIVLDEPLLGMDNFSSVQEFRNHPLTTSIPIVLVTATARWFSSCQLKQLGIVGAIAKPFDPMTLPEQLAKLLSWKSQLT